MISAQELDWLEYELGQTTCGAIPRALGELPHKLANVPAHGGDPGRLASFVGWRIQPADHPVSPQHGKTSYISGATIPWALGGSPRCALRFAPTPLRWPKNGAKTRATFFPKNTAQIFSKFNFRPPNDPKGL